MLRRRLLFSALAVCALALAAPGGALAASSKPAVTTGPAANLTPTTVTLTGSVNPHGAATTYFFQYGPTSLYGATTPAAAAGAGTRRVAVAVNVAALAPATRYHFRLVARNRHGLVKGDDRRFKTKPQPLGLSLALTPNPIRFGQNAALTGTLSGTGNAGRQVVIQSNPWPYTRGFATISNPLVTNTLGGFSYPLLQPGVNTQFRVLMPQKPEVVSPIVTLGVQVRVSTHVRSHRARRGHKRGRARFSGRITPARDGALVLIQRLRKQTWKTVARTGARHASATHSRYSRRLRLRHGGRFRVLVVVADGSLVSNAGRTVHFHMH